MKLPLIALLAKAPDRQLGLVREIAAYISPRPGFTQHPLTVHAAAEMIHLVERALHFRGVMPSWAAARHPHWERCHRCGQGEGSGDHSIRRAGASYYAVQAVSNTQEPRCFAGLAHREGAEMADSTRRYPSESLRSLSLRSRFGG